MRLTVSAVSNTQTDLECTEFAEVLEWLEAEFSKKKQETVNAQISAKTSKLKQDKLNFQEQYEKGVEECKRLKL